MEIADLSLDSYPKQIQPNLENKVEEETKKNKQKPRKASAVKSKAKVIYFQYQACKILKQNSFMFIDLNELFISHSLQTWFKMTKEIIEATTLCKCVQRQSMACKYLVWLLINI